ncbi:putative disease resistance protein RGA4 [Hordeum vulgare]|nr:putative disease resistance protein RGA4 [Hordeum vulgare]
MEVALGSAASLLGKVWTTLSDGLVAAYVDSLQLGQNSEQIRDKLMHAQGLLHNAQGSHIGHNPGLQGLLEKLSRDADQAEDLLDEVSTTSRSMTGSTAPTTPPPKRPARTWTALSAIKLSTPAVLFATP